MTWNDYEEGTEIESGIDNCLTLSASVAANTLQWTIIGNENTVDHYSVYISSDGENLMPLDRFGDRDSLAEFMRLSNPRGKLSIVRSRQWVSPAWRIRSRALSITLRLAMPAEGRLCHHPAASAITIFYGFSCGRHDSSRTIRNLHRLLPDAIGIVQQSHRSFLR